MALSVSYKGQKYTVPWTEELQTLKDLSDLLIRNADEKEPGRFRIVVGGRKLHPHETPNMQLQDAGGALYFTPPTCTCFYNI